MISEKELLDMRKRLSVETIDDQEEFSMWLAVNGNKLPRSKLRGISRSG